MVAARVKTKIFVFVFSQQVFIAFRKKSLRKDAKISHSNSGSGSRDDIFGPVREIVADYSEVI
jgi:hypothetical protein